MPSWLGHISWVRRGALCPVLPSLAVLMKRGQLGLPSSTFYPVEAPSVTLVAVSEEALTHSYVHRCQVVEVAMIYWVVYGVTLEHGREVEFT